MVSPRRTALVLICLVVGASCQPPQYHDYHHEEVVTPSSYPDLQYEHHDRRQYHEYQHEEPQYEEVVTPPEYPELQYEHHDHRQYLEYQHEEPQYESPSRQAVALGAALLPVLATVLVPLVSNLATGFTNAITATFANRRLAIMPSESFNLRSTNVNYKDIHHSDHVHKRR